MVWTAKKIGCLILLLLPFFEPPPTFNEGASIVELFTLFVFGIEQILTLMVFKKHLLRQNWKWLTIRGGMSSLLSFSNINISSGIILLVLLVDCLLTIFESNFHEFRPLRLLRVLLVVENSRQTRSNAKYYISLIPTIFRIFLGILLYIAIFLHIGEVIFRHSDPFMNPQASFKTLFLLLTTVNYPDVSLNLW
jgi:amino acid transporter